MELVSICIPAYKVEHFRESLTSAIAQTYPNIEILVSDDSPGDHIRALCEQFPRQVTYVRNPNPDGCGRENLRHLCRIARGEFIKFLFDDDVLHPFCVQYLLDALKRTAGSGTVLAYSPRDIIDGANNRVAAFNVFNVRDITIIPGPQLIAFMAMNQSNPIGEFTTVLFRRADILDAAGQVDVLGVDGDEWKGLGDVAAWTSLALKGAVVAHPYTLSYFRSHMASNSNVDVNKDLIYAVTDWKKLLDFAHRRGLIDHHQARVGYGKLIQNYRAWSERLPALQEDIARLVADRDGLPQPA